MMPDEWASIRSIARWVLPVLVGPSTAVTPWPRATASRDVTKEKDIAIRIPATVGPLRPLVGPRLYHNVTPATANSLASSLLGTSPERIASESLTRRQCGFVPGDIWGRCCDTATRCWGKP